MITFASLISSSSGNSTFISDGETNILVDCGASGKCIQGLLKNINVDIADINAVLVTHEHTDHIKGVGVISRRYNIPIYATEKTHFAMSGSIGNINEKNICIVEKDIDFSIGDIGIRAFSIPHDAADPVGYNLFAENEKISVATDVGEMNTYVENAIIGSDRVLLESNHDVEMLKFGNYTYQLKKRILSPVGHLSNDNAAKTALKLVQNGTKQILLGHLSPENNTPDIAFHTTRNILISAGVDIGRDMLLGVARQSEVTVF